jgi:hypothetical protein
LRCAEAPRAASLEDEAFGSGSNPIADMAADLAGFCAVIANRIEGGDKPNVTRAEDWRLALPGSGVVIASA